VLASSRLVLPPALLPGRGTGAQGAALGLLADIFFATHPINFVAVLWIGAVNCPGDEEWAHLGPAIAHDSRLPLMNMPIGKKKTSSPRRASYMFFPGLRPGPG